MATTQQDINNIVWKACDTFRDFNAGKLNAGIIEDKFSYVATFEEITENEFNLNIPRYVDTFEEEEEVDLKAVQVTITDLEKELAAAQKKIKDYLEELGLSCSKSNNSKV